MKESSLKKALFIDRDGTIIAEPDGDYQVDNLEKFHFLPGVISSLKAVARLDYRFVMVTNQDGMGTESFPETDFWPAQNLMMETLAGEGVHFDEVLIDRTFEHENADTRKPGTGMLRGYMDGSYDLSACYVIGDRLTDMGLAANLGARGIFRQPREKGAEMLAGTGLEQICALITDDWREIAEFLRLGERTASVRRTTRETDISMETDLDGRGESHITTGLGFLDHMLDQLVHHGGISLNITCKGDLHVDEHHTMEDVAIALGEAVYKALGSKRGIERYGFALPMDESAALVLLDFGGRSDLEWDVRFAGERIGDVPTQMMRHFFKSFCDAARCNLRVSARGENDHHMAEAIFKALARALKAAVRRDEFNCSLPSSKGVL
jgi:imidazoleglycerol-phosphate dehydratase/histidinol-phosphatase